MKLLRARVTKFRSIDDSGWVEFDDVTCMVGKNESGKTAFLQALARLRPVKGQLGKYDPVLDYPSKDYGLYRRRHDEGNADTVVDAEFELTVAEFRVIENRYGPGVLPNGRKLRLTKDYLNNSPWNVDSSDDAVVAHLLNKAELTAAVKAQAGSVSTVAGLAAFLTELPEPGPDAASVLELITSWKHGYRNSMGSYFNHWVPQFLYFDDYSVMEGRVSVQHLQSKVANDDLTDAERTFLSFLAVGGATLDEFENEDNFERLTRALEATANSIGGQVFKYWTQNTQLRVTVLPSNADPEADPPLNSGNILNVRIRNNRHDVTVPFDERSRGFVWFFSFFAFFSNLDAKPGTVILLLDEPGLSLHAKAQSDFLNFIDERLSEDFQVVYTTHSPFLIDARRLDRIRTVEDKDDEGTVVSADVLRNDRDTVFPMQAALGYDLAQTLFIGPDCLLVEGPSDLIYLQILGEAVRAAGGEPLDDRWVVTPVGGADKLSTFVSLIGANQLNVAVLMDVSKNEQQRIRNLQENGYLGNNAVVEVGKFVGNDDADIEDLFTPAFYVKLVNGAYATKLNPKLTLKLLTDKNPRITRRVESYFKANNVGNGRFNHFPPSSYLLREQKTLLKQLDDKTIERATEMFKVLNGLLS